MLQGCYHTNAGVRCDFNYATKSDTLEAWTVLFAEVVAADGANIKPSGVSVVNGEFDDNNTPAINVYKGVPVKVSALFDLPRTTTNLRILTVEGKRADNVPVRNSAAAAAPAPVTAAPAQAINISGNWTASLTGCKQVKPNEVVCAATLRK
ncbi:hypothetical protein [Deinococcus sp. SL84]|uniref:hypothetical protein n=1 Tax=Deinococcus sp. SL84 TaxID=2994663 RepID=UPI002274BFEA|nr:hypothetical protein [Deinococcus sp. SL84]MCY1704275.1 hypothetical protein [Deinococcus sp. SL84]